MTPTPDDATGRFAREAARLAAGPLPEAVAEHAALSLFNVLATAVGAARHPGVDAIVALGARHGAPGVSAPPGRPERLDAHHTAMATAFAAHVDDFDDTHLATVIHPGAACLGVVTALAGEERDGAHALRAFAAGCEAQLRLGLSVTPWHYDRGWHITGTCGPVGAAVTAMSLLGVPEGRWEHGVGHALHATLGMREGFGTMCKALHPARAAANGIRAARLAVSGVDGPRRSLPAGAWVEALAGRLSLDELLGDRGRWRLLENTFKPYPCGIVSHPAIEAAEALAPRVRGAAIERVEIRCHPLVPELTGNPQPADGLQARFSTIHAVAAGLLDGTVMLAQYDDKRVRAGDLVELRARTTLVGDEACACDAAELRVTAGGEELVEVVEHAHGSLARPLGWDDLRAKAEPLAEDVLGAGGAERLEAAVRELAGAAGLTGLLGAAAPAGAPTPHAAEPVHPSEGPVTSALAAFAVVAEPPPEALSAAAAELTAIGGVAAGDAGAPASAYRLAAASGSGVAAAALAVVDRDAPVGELAAAVAVGQEVRRRLEAALAQVIGPWLPEATAGLVGAAAAAARASGADAATTATALAIAATQCTGFADEPGDRCRALAAAHAAEVAVEAAELAGLGFTGPAAALEGRRGMFALLTGAASPPAGLLDGLGERWGAPAGAAGPPWALDEPVAAALG
jgi:2-methylcitrate dehydratase PrpD